MFSSLMENQKNGTNLNMVCQACLVGALTGVIIRTYGLTVPSISSIPEYISMTLFDSLTTVYTYARIYLGPYVNACANLVFGNETDAAKLCIHRITVHKVDGHSSHSSASDRYDMSQEEIQRVFSGELVPQDIKAKAITVEYSLGQNGQHYFNLVHTDSDGCYNTDSFLPNTEAALANDYIICDPYENGDNDRDDLAQAIHAYLEYAPVSPHNTAMYLACNPDVFQFPDYPEETKQDAISRKKIAMSRFFERKESIVLEDDLGDQVYIRCE